MYTRSAILFLGCAMVVGALAAQTAAVVKPAVVKRVPITSTPAESGSAMFLNYCASCHGKDGRGDGPAAPALKKAPSDLTQLTIRNNGKFPDLAVYETVVGDQIATAHGSRDMPVWGDVLKSLNGNSDLMLKLRLANLTDYVKSLQRK